MTNNKPVRIRIEYTREFPNIVVVLRLLRKIFLSPLHLHHFKQQAVAKIEMSVRLEKRLSYSMLSAHLLAYVQVLLTKSSVSLVVMCRLGTFVKIGDLSFHAGWEADE